MSRRTWSFNLLPYLAAAVLLFTAAPVFAAPAGAGPDRLDQMVEDGWSPVAPGVLQRSKGGHKVETFAMGTEGFSWMVGQLQAQLGFLMDEYRARPTAQLRRTLRNQRAEIAKLQAYTLETKSAAPLTEALIAGCDFSYGAHADAYPTKPTQGVRADADAYFNNNCAYSGDTYAYAYARATLNGTTTTITQTDPDSGANISSYATAAVPGTADCYSYSTARVTSLDLGISYSTADENFVCPVPLTATINGPASVTIYDYNCALVTWTSTVAGGTPGYSYAWYIDGYYVGSGSAISRKYCGSGRAYTDTENVSLTVTDSLGWTASDTHTTYIYFRTSTIDPCLAESTKALPYPCPY
jgi:hypothetical protein